MRLEQVGVGRERWAARFKDVVPACCEAQIGASRGHLVCETSSTSN